MGKPGRSFFLIYEVAMRWSCTPSDIVEWAIQGHMKLVTSAPFVIIGGQLYAGMVEIEPSDLLTAFRRMGDDSSPTCRIIRLKRLSVDEAEWSYLDPAEPYEIALRDVLVPREDADKFELSCGMVQKDIRAGVPRYDWDGMWAFVCRRLFDEGVPETLLELIQEAQEWFQRETNGTQMPDDSTIRKRLNPLWRQLRESEG